MSTPSEQSVTDYLAVGRARFAELDQEIASGQGDEPKPAPPLRVALKPPIIPAPRRPIEEMFRDRRSIVQLDLPRFAGTFVHRLNWIWSMRRCWVCDGTGQCQHREPLVDLAEMDGLELRAQRNTK